MVRSRRGLIIDLLSRGYSDEEIIKVIDLEFPPGIFSTSNRQALSGTKWDINKSGNQPKPQRRTIVKTIQTTASRQGKTGDLTEALVAKKLSELKLEYFKPVPDRGIDFIVINPDEPTKKLKIQVKGRGKIQRDKKYRWFQIRPTKKQREETVADGLPISEAWRKKAALVDVFIFVSERYNEFWIFESKDIENLIHINRLSYGNRSDNKAGEQTEINLDVKYFGKPLTDIYKDNLNNWNLITIH